MLKAQPEYNIISIGVGIIIVQEELPKVSSEVTSSRA